MWNKTLKKYQDLAENNSTELRNTMLFNFIQNKTILIKREFGETYFNELMREQKCFIDTCVEILNLKHIKQTHKYIYIYQKEFGRKLK